MNKTRLVVAAILGLACISSASAGGMSIGAPNISGVSPGLSQRCLQQLGVKAQGAQAARAAHECRKPVGPPPPGSDQPRTTADPIKQP
ncbi:MAG: hypothetical protein JWR16_112 [Nevskia sp.]|nr:hypothetical protein [Nevskia sp.]